MLALALAALALSFVAWVVVTFFVPVRAPQMAITNFEECAAAGYPVMESYPRQCRSEDGQLFVEELPPERQVGDGIGLVANGCAVAGCSGQLCVAAIEADNIMTTCEYRAEYGCYREASCEPQASGQCGWTQTPELTQCLANPPAIEGDLEVM